MAELACIHLGSLEVSRLLVGGNPISGFSHQNSERSRQMVEYFTVERIKGLWRVCEEKGITALVARADAFVMRVDRFLGADVRVPEGIGLIPAVE